VAAHPKMAKKKKFKKSKPDPFKKVLAVVVVLGLVVVAAFAALALWPKSGETEAAVCALLIDRTGSSNDVKTQASYESRAMKTIDGCRNLRSALVINYFDNENAKVQPATGNQPFLLFRPQTRRKSLGENDVAKTMAATKTAVDSVFAGSSGSGRGSDIVTALKLTADDLQSLAATDGITKQYIVVLTDGYQTGQDLSMKRVFTSSQVSSDALLHEVKAYGLVPALNDVDLSFVGVGGGVASNKAQIPDWYEAKVRQFWVSLVAAGGGKMCVYNVEATTLPGLC
jgi:hypothetical protein